MKVERRMYCGPLLDRLGMLRYHQHDSSAASRTLPPHAQTIALLRQLHPEQAQAQVAPTGTTSHLWRRCLWGIH